MNIKKILIFCSFIFLLSACSIDITSKTIEIPENRYHVSRVIDGDTIVANINGQDQSIRLVGIDAPECDGPYTEEEYFGEEAKHYLKFLLEDTYVHLLADPSQNDKDVYQRLLRYVFTDKGENVNLSLLQQGYVREYTHITPYQWQERFLAAQAEAQAGKKGLWAEVSE